jgi:hypothetical protein
MDINEHLATVVMGFTIKKRSKHPSKPSNYFNKNGRFVCLDYLWDPVNNIEHAEMCLNNFVRADIVKLGDLKTVTIINMKMNGGDGSRYTETSTVLSEAISMACAKATGF